MNILAQVLGLYWIVTKDGDPRVSDIYKRHYSCHAYSDNRRNQPKYRNRHLVLGPGEKMVLISSDCRAIFGWRKFIDRSGQKGVNCAFFRNEGAFGGAVRSSQLIMLAEKFAFRRWGPERLYTYVNPIAVKSTNPGFTFLKAGWQKCGLTKSGLIIMEKYPEFNNSYCA